MSEIIHSYFIFLTQHPDMINSIILWNITMSIVWYIQFKYGDEFRKGSKGKNGLFEHAEQFGYVLSWVWPPVLCYSAYFQKELSVWVWYVIIGGIMYTVGGRWLFEWALAFRAGKTRVEETVTVKVEQDTQSETK